MQFSSSNCQISEFSQNVLIKVTKDLHIASSVTLSIIPWTIDEAVILGNALPMTTTSHEHSHSHNRASEFV